MSELALELVKGCLKTKNKYLNLGNCGLTDDDFKHGTSLDIELRKCIHIQGLILSNKFDSTTQEKWTSPQFTGQKNYLTAIPKTIKSFEQLETFIFGGDVSNNWELGDLSFIRDFKQLINLDLSFNQIKTIEGIETLKLLAKLNLSVNRITSLSMTQDHLSLQNMDLSYNEISSLNGFEKFKNIRQLDLSYNLFSQLSGIAHLRHLESLNLHNNKIEELNGIRGLNLLKELDLSVNKISSLDGVETLNSLEKIDCSNNHLGNLEPLKNLEKLTHLKLTNNKIETIVPLEELSKLSYLNLSCNQLKSIENLFKLSYLLELHLNENLITRLENIKKLTHLKLLDIRRNKISDIRSLVPLIKDEANGLKIVNEYIYISDNPGEILIEGNPITNPPIEIIDQGNRAILDYFEALDQESIINCEAKCILLGNGEVGKTALSYQLRKNDFLEKNRRSHGILVEQWILKSEEFPDSLKIKIGQTIEQLKSQKSLRLLYPEYLKLNIWDFGGQEYYHATHRLFLSSNVLYLLLWESKTNKQDDKLGNYPYSYWLKNINHFSTNSVVLNIQNKVQGQSQPVDKDLFLKIEFRDKTNLKSVQQYDLDIEDLKQAILKHISKLSYIGQPFPKVYDDIRRVLQFLDQNYITFDGYETICEQTDITNDRVMSGSSQKETLLNFLDNTGTVVCFRFRDNMSSETLKNYVFNKPKWLTGVIYEILEKEKFEFDAEHIEKITSKYKLQSEVWIDIMKEFELIFEIKRSGVLKYIAPQYLPDKPGEEIDEALSIVFDGKKMHHSFTLAYPDFLPKSNFLRFISRYGKQNLNYIYWRNGLAFIKKGKAVFATCKPDERKIILKVQDNDKELSKELFDALTEIDEPNDLQMSLNEQDYVNVKKLKEKMANNNREIESTTETTLGVVDFSLVFDDKLPAISDETKKNHPTNKVFDEVKPLKKKSFDKKVIKIFLASSSELRIERERFEMFINQENKHLNNKDVFLKLEKWEDFIDAISQTRLQDEYNLTIEASDIFVMLFFSKVGKYTGEEFEKAFKNFKSTSNPKIYTYFKAGDVRNTNINRDDIISLWAFQDKLKELGHFYTEFENDAQLHLHFKKQLEKLYNL